MTAPDHPTPPQPPSPAPSSAAAEVVEPTLAQRLSAAADAYAEMSPVDRALCDADQRRSFVRGQCGRDPGPDVLAEEVRRLRGALAAANTRAEKAEGRANGEASDAIAARKRVRELLVENEAAEARVAELTAEIERRDRINLMNTPSHEFGAGPTTVTRRRDDY